MRFFLILAASALLAATTTGDPYQKWRADYEASLKSPGGWLSVAGLIWLHDGANTITLPNQKTAVLQFEAGKVTFEKRVLKSDITDHPDVLKFGDVTLTVIERGGKTGARLRDPNAETRRDFTGCKWF